MPVTAKSVPPARLEISNLAGIAQFLRAPGLAARGLVADEHRGKFHKRRPTAVGEAQTEVDIGKLDRQIDGVETV